MRKPNVSPKRAAIWARYLLPPAVGGALLILSFFYSVRYFQLGEGYEQTLFNFYKNTFTASHTYLAGELQAGKNALYGWLSAGAVVGILCYVAGLFFTGLAALSFFRAFRGGAETPDARRAKLIFKIAFPNRICLFLSDCLFLVPALFPQFFAWVAAKVSGVGSGEMLYIDRNIPLTLMLILTGVMLALAIYAGRVEQTEGLDPFTLEAPLVADGTEDGIAQDE